MHCLRYKQKLPISREACWDFFSNPTNLKKLTPEHLQFTCTSQTGKMYAGQIITYTIRPFLHIPIKWVTEITHMEYQVYFIDEQRFGPYKFWHHEHRLNTITHGVEMTDTIYYKLPWGLLGTALNRLKVQSDVEAIFAYRKTKMESLFGIYSENNF